jgi:hypothetical protein
LPPQTPVNFFLSPFLGARAANPVGTAHPDRHHSNHHRSQYRRSAAVGHLAGNPEPALVPPADPRHRRHRIPRSARTREKSHKIPFLSPFPFSLFSYFLSFPSFFLFSFLPSPFFFLWPARLASSVVPDCAPAAARHGVPSSLLGAEPQADSMT